MHKEKAPHSLGDDKQQKREKKQVYTRMDLFG